MILIVTFVNKKVLFPEILTFSIRNIKFLNNNHLKENNNN